MSRVCFFFFKQKTAYEIKECDWSSDVCSSDLGLHVRSGVERLQSLEIAHFPEPVHGGSCAEPEALDRKSVV